MSLPLRVAYSSWPRLNVAFRKVVAQLTDEQLTTRPSPERWPLWATIGHAACQRVFAWCDVMGAPGAATSMFPNAAWNCPGDDDLETVYDAAQLAEALESTFRIVERCLDEWTLESLADEIVHDDGERTTRGRVVQRSFAHDVSHMTEVNETLSRMGLELIDLWG